MGIRKSSGKLAGIRVVDVDVHVSDAPQVLAPYCEMPWRKSLEMLGKVRHGYVDVPGFAPAFRTDAPIPGGNPSRSCRTAQEMREGLDMLGVDDGILLPDNLLSFANLPNPEYAVAISRAYNRWLAAEWLEEGNGLHGAILACPQDPEISAKEIAKHAETPGMAAVFLPTAGIYPLWGNRRYFPILRAAEEAGLPVILHSVGLVAPVFPNNQEQFENVFGRHVINHSFCMQANLSSLMHTGVPARLPNLKIAFTEAGIAWVPLMMWRMDRSYHEFRRTVPVLQEPPSEYMKRQMWFGTQPFEEPTVPEHFVETIGHFFGDDRTVFCSDWPHHDFDHPDAIANMPLTNDQRRKIMGQNAVELFGLPPVPQQAAPREDAHAVS